MAQGNVVGRKWTPTRAHHHGKEGGFFHTPFRFWGALTTMLLIFVVYVTYLNSSGTKSSQPQLLEQNVETSKKSNASPMWQSKTMSLAELERVAGIQQESSPSSSVNEDENVNEEEEEEDGEPTEETESAANSAASSDLLSNEAYPVYELPAGGSALNQVQEEINPSDIPDNTRGMNEEETLQQSLDDDDIFEDAAAYKKAPIIQSPEESPTLKYREIVLQHERYYRSHPSRLYVPKLKKTARLSVAQFAERFLKHSQPVVIPFEAMRHLGFDTKSFTLDELLEVYPNYKRTFVYKYGSPGPGELDLGPAVWALKQGDALRKTATGRNFPRNTKIKLDKLSRLKLQPPAYIIPGTPMLTPSLWFATITSSTKLHSDCCDNYALMISGTKRWTLAPPHEARVLLPACYGGLCWVKRLEHPDEHASTPKEKELADRIQKVTFDLGPNEMLFLPTGWFHHVENVGPTIMINFWTKGGPGFLKFLDGSMYETLNELKKQENAQSA